ncbi:MAG: DUF4974 domain-containing protein [Tannerellaceae bacterium]|jgi:ferric-dicitrate binding protein FerR (iron transport regulator)|nr:DUF4974 domain-containing protein [Tannerellaceae bacterium]
MESKKIGTDVPEEELSAEVARVLESIKPEDASEHMAASRDVVWKMVGERITGSGRRPAPGARRRHLLRYMTAAVAAALMAGSAFSLLAMHRYKARLDMIAGSEVFLSVPFGVISEVRLPDGTRVTLNGGSRLSYDPSFMGGREVDFSGEGFFVVARDEERPFTVKSDNLTVKVLGTRFGFKSYKGEAITALTLEEGSVCAFPAWSDSPKGIMLEPRQQIVVNNKTREVARRSVRVDDYTAWKDNILVFRDETLSEIAVRLERRFDVKINIRPGRLRDERYVARFQYGENLEQILEKLSYKRSWKFIRQHGSVDILPRTD